MQRPLSVQQQSGVLVFSGLFGSQLGVKVFTLVDEVLVEPPPPVGAHHTTDGETDDDVCNDSLSESTSNRSKGSHIELIVDLDKEE